VVSRRSLFLLPLLWIKIARKQDRRVQVPYLNSIQFLLSLEALSQQRKRSFFRVEEERALCLTQASGTAQLSFPSTYFVDSIKKSLLLSSPGAGAGFARGRRKTPEWVVPKLREVLGLTARISQHFTFE